MRGQLTKASNYNEGLEFLTFMKFYFSDMREEKSKMKQGPGTDRKIFLKLIFNQIECEGTDWI